MQNKSLLVSLVALSALLTGCADNPTYTAPDRLETDRTPQSAACGDTDEIRCLLPWPSNHYLKTDATTETGLRLNISAESLQFPDDPSSLALADGFSRLTPLVVGFPSELDPATLGEPGSTSIHLFLAQHDHPRKGEEIPLRAKLVPGEDPITESILIGYPLRPLEPNADYIAVVTADLKAPEGKNLTPSHTTRLALGLDEPASQEEANLQGYHAPTRALLKSIGANTTNILRVFNFTTRSKEDPTKRLSAMREAAIAAIDAGKVSVEIDKVEIPASPNIAAIITGHLKGLPSFRQEDGDLNTDATGNAAQTGEREALFRVMVPKGQGNYRFLMWGHGMGGDYDDSSFDEIIASKGAGKVGIRFHGWTGDELISTFAGVIRMFEGTHRSSAGLMTAIADATAVEHAMVTILGDALAAPTLDGGANPLASRRPDDSIPLWAGGSLGGTMGLVYTAADPAMHYGVLNVPGAGWTHFVPSSDVYNTLRGLLRTSYGGDLDVARAFAMSQPNWDDIDGAIWADKYPEEKSVYCIQESIGDPILPNDGTAMLSIATGAIQLGTPISPILGITPANPPTQAENQTALTQFKVTSNDAYNIHGFAAENGPEGDAAREQMFNFVTSVWQNQPQIKLPTGCTNESCDFTKK